MISFHSSSVLTVWLTLYSGSLGAFQQEVLFAVLCGLGCGSVGFPSGRAPLTTWGGGVTDAQAGVWDVVPGRLEPVAPLLLWD